MNLVEKPPEEFDREAFQRAADKMKTLAERLPDPAFQELAREVVARLSQRVAQRRSAFSSREIEALSDALVSGDPDAALHLVDEKRRSGAAIEAIYLDYLAPAARRLGELWESDDLTFAEVAVGSTRIYGIMRGLRRAFAPPGRPMDRRAVFAAPPGETHTLGLGMAADLFSKDGWQVSVLTGLDHDELVDEIEAVKCEVIGLTGSGHRSLAPLARLIVALRVSNPSALILVSGNIAEEEPDLERIVGADAVATDIRAAIVAMDELFDG